MNPQQGKFVAAVTAGRRCVSLFAGLRRKGARWECSAGIKAQQQLGAPQSRFDQWALDYFRSAFTPSGSNHVGKCPVFCFVCLFFFYREIGSKLSQKPESFLLSQLGDVNTAESIELSLKRVRQFSLFASALFIFDSFLCRHFNSGVVLPVELCFTVSFVQATR